MAVAGLVVVLGAAGLSAVDPPSAVAAPTTSGLVLNYRFDSDSGVSARDSSPNAIHGTYWRSNFGERGSNGCVGLSDADAKTVFDWAPEGTRIKIHY